VISAAQHRLDRSAIAKLIPHAGAMCLLDEVIGWDEHSIEARSDGHRATNHPLRRGAHLPALALIEYGAQAMAVHGGLLAQAAGAPVQPGLLASARDVRLLVDTLEAIESVLEIRAERLVASGDGWLYAFQIIASQQKIAEGRVAVVTVRDAILAGL